MSDSPEPYDSSDSELAEIPTEAVFGQRPSSTHLALIGSTVGRYTIRRLLGEGGMGVVYEAEQARPIRRKVALKLIKPGMDTAAVLARFEAERQALAVMDHPNIARVLDGGATESGTPYFVMELVKGVPITDFCDRHELSLEARARLLISVCQAVQHAHAKGVIHRDIKPSNILVEYEGGTATPKMIDFGVAKAMDQRLTERTLFTEQGQLIGTPEYMSPEQAEMSGLDIDTRSDVYSLGAVLYELLVGVTPFDSEELRKAGFGEIQRVIRDNQPVKPSTRISTMRRSVAPETIAAIAKSRKLRETELDSELRGDLDWITLRCLEKDRERRYATPQALSDDLERYLNDEAVEAGPPSARYRLGKFLKRNRKGAVVAAAVLFTLLAGILTTTSMWLWAMHEREIAQDQRAEAITQTAAAESARAETQVALEENEVIREELVQALTVAEREQRKTEWETYKLTLSAAGGHLSGGNTFEALRTLRSAPERHRREGASLLHTVTSADIRVLGQLAGIRDLHSVPGGVIAVTTGEIKRFDDDGRVLWDTAVDVYSPNSKINETLSRLLVVSDIHAVGDELSFAFSLDIVTGTSVRHQLQPYEPPGPHVLGYVVAKPNDNSAPRPVMTIPRAPLPPAETASTESTLVVSDVYGSDSSRSSRAYYDGNYTGRLIAFDFDGDVLWRHRSPGGRMFSVLRSDVRGETYAGNGAGEVFRVLDADTGTLEQFTDVGARIEDLAIHEPSGLLAAACRDGVIRVWKLEDASLVAALPGLQTTCSQVAFSASGRSVYVGDYSGQVYSISLDVLDSRLASLDVTRLELVPGTDSAIAVCSEGVIHVLPDSQSASVAYGKIENIYRLAYDPESGRVAVVSFQDDESGAQTWALHCFERGADRPFVTIENISDRHVTVLNLNPGGEIALIAVENADYHAAYDLNSSQLMWERTVLGWGAPLSGTVDHARDTWLVAYAGGGIGSFAELDIQSGEIIVQSGFHGDWARRVAATPDGQRVITGHQNGDVVAWERFSGRKIAVLGSHHESVSSIAISGDSERLVTSSETRTLIWDLVTGDPVCSLSPPTASIRSISIDPSRNLVSAVLNRNAWDRDGALLDILQLPTRLNLDNAASRPEFAGGLLRDSFIAFRNDAWSAQENDGEHAIAARHYEAALSDYERMQSRGLEFYDDPLVYYDGQLRSFDAYDLAFSVVRSYCYARDPVAALTAAKWFDSNEPDPVLGRRRALAYLVGESHLRLGQTEEAASWLAKTGMSPEAIELALTMNEHGVPIPSEYLRDGVIPWYQAGDHIGKEVEVVGWVTNVVETSGRHRATFDFTVNRKGCFVLHAPKEATDAWSTKPDAAWSNKWVKAKGVVTTFRHRVQIDITDPSQVSVLDTVPE